MEKTVVGAFTKYHTQHCQPSLTCLPSGDIVDGGDGGAGLTEGGGWRRYWWPGAEVHKRPDRGGEEGRLNWWHV